MENHFSDAFRYVQTENSSQLENYATEMLVLILCYLKSDEGKFSKVNKQIADLLGFSEEDYQDVRFETQKNHTDFSCEINNKLLIPDISIYVNGKLHTAIEVKIDQGLNQYTKKDGTSINQLEAYASIKDVKKVILLSKYHEEIDEKYKSIKWNQIYEILKSQKNDFIIKNFLNFLNEFYIGKNDKFENKTTDILKYIGSFLALLRNAWGAAKVEGFFLSKTVYANEYGLGFYIREKDNSNQSEHFLGINHYDGFRNQIGFWTKKEMKDNEEFTKVNDGGFISNSNKSLKEISEEDYDEQINTLSDWIIKNIKPILESNQQEG